MLGNIKTCLSTWPYIQSVPTLSWLLDFFFVSFRVVSESLHDGEVQDVKKHTATDLSWKAEGMWPWESDIYAEI